MKRTLCALALALPAPGLAAETHDKAFWREIAGNRYAVPGGTAVFPLARELGGYHGSADPELRDDLAYSILAAWLADPQRFSSEELRSLGEEWTANLKAGIGDSGQDSVFRR